MASAEGDCGLGGICVAADEDDYGWLQLNENFIAADKD